MRRRIKWIAISLGVGICLLASAYLSRDVLIAPRVAALIQAALSRELGMQVAIGRLGGSLLSDIEIEDLQTVIPGSQGPVSSLTVKRLHIRYGLFELLSGPAAFVGGMGIEADGLQAELDLDRGDPSSSEASPSAFFPLTLPAVQVRDGAVAIRRGELRTRFDGITLDIAKSAAAARRIRLAVAAWSWSHPFLAAGESILAADLTLAPDSIDIRELSLDGGRIAAVGRLGLTGPADPFPFEARLKLGETWLSLAGDFSSSVLNLKLKTDPVEIEPIAALFRQPMSGRLSADIDLSVPFDRPEAVSGRLQLDVLNARINGVALATAGVAAGVADGWVRVADLKAASGHSRLKLTDAAAPLNHLLDGAWGDLLRELSGRFALSSEDLPELFQLIGLSTEPAPERVPEHRLELSGRLDGGYVHIPHAGLSSGSNRIQIQDLETRLHPAPADTPLKGRLRANLPDLEALSRLFPLVSTSGSVQADATIGGTFGRPEADAVVAAENLKLGGQDVGSVSLKVHCERQQAQVKTLAVRRGADTLDGTASIRLPAGYIDAAELAFTVADLEGLGRQFFPAGWTIGGERPRVQGRARGQVNLSGHWNSPDGELAAIFEDLRLNDSRFGTGSVRMLKRGGTVTANPVRLEQGDDRLELQGSWDFAAGRLAAVRLRIDWAEAGAYLGAFASPWNGVSGRLRAMVDASGPVHRPDFALDLFLERIPAGSGSLAETHIMARGAGRRIDIETAETVTPIGRLRAAGSFAQSSAGAVWDATIDAFRLDGEQLQLTMTQPARIRYEAGRGFWIDAFEWTGPEGHRVAIAGALPVDPAGDPVLAPGALALTATVDIPSQDLLRQLVPAWPIAAGAIEARLALEGSWAAPRGALQLAGRDMTLAADSIYAPPGPSSRCTAPMPGFGERDPGRTTRPSINGLPENRRLRASWPWRAAWPHTI
ncbi:MAG: hypothetical protein MUC57_02800 [Desulfobacterales bacterium]|nr:hypothetical protein [Desulfobacterales bacterium]